MTYDIVDRGSYHEDRILSTHGTEAAAVARAKQIDGEIMVVAHEISGTWESVQCVWPERYESYGWHN